MLAKIKKFIFGILIWFAVLGCGTDTADSTSKPVGPRVAAKGLDSQGRMQISADDRCPVCAMFPYKNKKFACAIELKDERVFYFCGTGCLIRTLLHPEVFLGVQSEMVRRAVVSDYFTGEQIDAYKAIWVAGSDVIGPMGPAIVPLKSEQDARVFQERHGGKHSFRLADLDDSMWKRVTGKPVVPDGDGKHR